MNETETKRLERVREAAVRVDTRPDLLRMAAWLRRRLPGDDRYGDPLSTAGERAVDRVARGVTVLSPPRPSVVGELGLGALQVWQAISEAQGRGRGEREVALLFTDLVGFSAWALRAGDELALELLRDVGVVLERAIENRRGRIVKRLGDGAMAVFPTAQDAVEAALDAQEALARVNVAGHTPRMRAGVHWGRPRRLGGDYLGVDVNIAARVGEAARASQVLVSESAYEQVDASGMRVGRAKPLRAQGAPRELRVRSLSRA